MSVVYIETADLVGSLEVLRGWGLASLATDEWGNLHRHISIPKKDKPDSIRYVRIL